MNSSEIKEGKYKRVFCMDFFENSLILFVIFVSSKEKDVSMDFEIAIKWVKDWRIYTFSYLGYGKNKARQNILLSMLS